jgi:ubiquinone/menaquinone biosynthesis C-methylase UbiE
MPKLNTAVEEHDGVLFAVSRDADDRATRTWSPLATVNAIDAAAATHSSDPFAKYPAWIDEHIAGATGEFLDAGCGYGRVAIQILRRNPSLRCAGLDASPVMLTKFNALAQSEGVADRKTLYCGNLQRLPFDDDQFTFVLSSAVLLHLAPKDVQAALDEFARVLKPGGKLILTDSFPNSLTAEGLQQWPNQLRRDVNGPVRSYTRGQVRRMLRRRFSSVRIFGHGAILLPRVIGRINMPFGGMIRRINAAVGKLPLVRRAPVFVAHHNVVAVK